MRMGYQAFGLLPPLNPEPIHLQDRSLIIPLEEGYLNVDGIPRPAIHWHPRKPFRIASVSIKLKRGESNLYQMSNQQEE